MSNKIKIRYFDVRGRAEPIRMLLEEAGIDYEEDPHKDFTTWTSVKKDTPWHSLPIAWDEDGTMITQSQAILRYFARKYEFYGSNLKDNLRIDEVIEATNDGLSKAGELCWSPDWKEKLEKLENEFFIPQYGNLQKFFSKNNGPYLLGDTFSVGDISLWCYLDLVKPFLPNILENYSVLDQFYKEFASRDKIVNYLKSPRRRKTFTVSLAPMGGTPETSSQP